MGGASGSKATGSMPGRGLNMHSMKCISMRLLMFVLALSGTQWGPAAAADSPYYPYDGARNTKEAYATLCYGRNFLLGVRVLGQSLKDSGTNRCAPF